MFRVNVGLPAKQIRRKRHRMFSAYRGAELSSEKKLKELVLVTARSNADSSSTPPASACGIYVAALKARCSPDFLGAPTRRNGGTSEPAARLTAGEVALH